MNQFSTFKLQNDLRVAMAPMQDIPSVTVDVYIAAGGRYETKDKMGLSHFLEHMFFKGTKKRPTTLDISSLIDGVGGDNNAETGKEVTHFYIRLGAKNIELAFDVLSDMLKNSLYKEEEIDKERGTVTEELNLYEDTPMYKVEDVFYNLVLDKHPLGWFLIGSKESLKAIGRADFVDYAKDFYLGKRMVLAVAGKFNDKQVESLANRYFGDILGGGEPKLNQFIPTQSQPRVLVKHKTTDQAHFFYGYPAFSYFDTDRYITSVLSAILGGGMSSRLFIEVRERRGLAYYVSSSSDMFADTGIFAVRAGVTLEKINEAVKIVSEEIEKMKDKGQIKEKELQLAKEMIKGRTALSLENSRNVANWYGEKLLLEGKTETPAEVFKKIDQVTVDDVVRVANRIFKPELVNLAVIGPYQEGDIKISNS